MPELAVQRKLSPGKMEPPSARKGGALDIREARGGTSLPRGFCGKELIVETVTRNAAVTMPREALVREVLGRAGVPIGPVAGGGARAPPKPGYNLAPPAARLTWADEGRIYVAFHEFKTRGQFYNGARTLYRRLKKMDALDEVMPEDVVPLKNIQWKKRGKDWSVAYGKAYCESNNIYTEGKLLLLNRKLYDGLVDNGWLGYLHLGHLRNLDRMDDVQIITYAKEVIDACERVEARHIKFFCELDDLDSFLYRTLQERGLLNKLDLKWKKYRWKGLKKDELIAKVKEVADLLGVKTFPDFRDKMKKAYETVSKKGLLEEAGFPPSNMQWKHILAKRGKTAFIKMIRKSAKAVHARTRTDLSVKLPGAYKALAAEGLFDEAGFPNRHNMRKKDKNRGLHSCPEDGSARQDGQTGALVPGKTRGVRGREITATGTYG